MHEASLMQNMFELVENYSLEYRLTRVTRIVVHVGELAGISHEAMQFAFTAISQASIAEGAAFIIEEIPAYSRCAACAHEFKSALSTQTCPLCDGPAVLFTGKELHLQTLEGDQEE
jgi:hydrogenase nickel incorporation protein HypA/HybF